MLRPASFVPAVDHVIVDAFVDIALVVPHVSELIEQGDLWEVVLPMGAERIVVEEVLVLVELGDVVVSETFRAQPYCGIIVEASLVSSQIPV